MRNFLQTAEEYLTEYNSRRGEEHSRFHGYTYDGIWAAALAIQYVADRSQNNLSQFRYRVEEWENIFLEALRNTSFEGVTVRRQRAASLNSSRLFMQLSMGFRVPFDSTITNDERTF